MASGVRLTGRGSAAFGFIVCVAMVLACSSRTTPAAAPASPQSDALRPSPAATPTADSAECALIPEPGEPVGTVALTDRVDPANAPRPSNDAERVLFRQLYETLVHADCRG